MKGMALILAAALLLAGCASSGTKMDAADLERIEVGQTTQQEMVQMFGQPLAQQYSSEGHLTLTWHYVHVGPFGSNMQQQNLVAQFDNEGKVERYNMLDGSPSGTRLGY